MCSAWPFVILHSLIWLFAPFFRKEWSLFLSPAKVIQLAVAFELNMLVQQVSNRLYAYQKKT